VNPGLVKLVRGGDPRGGGVHEWKKRKIRCQAKLGSDGKKIERAGGDLEVSGKACWDGNKKKTKQMCGNNHDLATG